jgi:hypothetical protein
MEGDPGRLKIPGVAGGAYPENLSARIVAREAARSECRFRPV